MSEYNRRSTSRWIYYIVFGSLSGWVAVVGCRDFYNQSVSNLTFGDYSKYTITYDGKHLSHVDCFYESELGQQIDFFYDGSLLTEIKSNIA